LAGNYCDRRRFQKQVELERRLALQNIRSQQQPTIALSSCGKQCTKVILSSGLGYELASLIHRAVSSDVFRPDNLVISLAGRVTPIDAVALVSQVLVTGSGTTPLAHSDAALPLPSALRDDNATTNATIYHHAKASHHAKGSTTLP